MARGYGHRKLYPYVTKKQLNIAPGIKGFVDRNKVDLTHQGNTVLNAPGDMTKDQSKGGLRTKWGRTQSNGTSSRKVAKYIDSNGGSRGRAKKILTAAHAVKFGADPKSA